MKKITSIVAVAFMATVFAAQTSAAELVSCTIEKAIPEGWEYLTNNTAYPNPSFYTAGLKMNFETMGIKSPAFAAQATVDVTLDIIMNQNTKTGASDSVFTIEGLNASDAVVATAVINRATVTAAGTYTATLTGSDIVKISMKMTAYPYDGAKYCNVGLLGVSVTSAASGVENHVMLPNVKFNGMVISNQDHLQLAVYNATGTLVAISNDAEIDMRNQPRGMYIVRSGKSVLKIVK